MRRALALAVRGLGGVEPNPPVGAVLVDDELRLLGEGWHERFGGPHAEIGALVQAGEKARGATMYVTLEPCCHFGKTPPCIEALIRAGVRRVVAAMSDPAPHVAGEGFTRLREAGVAVEVGLLEGEAGRLAAPFVKLMLRGTPYVHAKWAMSLDGRIAARSGDSKWISSEESRRLAHELRGRMDAIVVGIGTVLADDPLLTARPAGPRVAARVVVDSSARLPPGSQLVATAGSAPVIAAVLQAAPVDRCAVLAEQGVEVLRLPAARGGDRGVDLRELLAALGRRQMTNVLVEGGGRVLGACFDAGLVDEYHVFIAPKLIGGAQSPGPLQGTGCDGVDAALRLADVSVRGTGGDLYVRGIAPQSRRL